MKIFSGLTHGAVLQRDANNLCRVLVEAEFAGAPTANFGHFEKIDENLWEFKGVFVGGPYEIIVQDEESSCVLQDVYVGDVWLLGGQSNMEASAHITYRDRQYETNPKPYLRAMYMDEAWKPAKPTISDLGKSTDEVHLRAHRDWLKSIKDRNIVVRDVPPYEIQRNVGPGLWFAEEMFRLTNGVPQGLIPAAVGGAPIEMWMPNCEPKNYFDAAARRVRLAGNNIKGFLWAQGEANANWEIYPEQIRTMRSALCEQLEIEEIPFVLMQLFKWTIDLSYAADCVWSRFREMQRRLQGTLPKTAMIATNDLALCDMIHLNSDSQRICGVRLANAMYHLVSGVGYAQPAIEKIWLEPALYCPERDSILKIKYQNLCGDLRSSGVPFGYTTRKLGSDEKPTIQYMQGIRIDKNTVCISFEKSVEDMAEYELFYGFGNDFYCNIVDGDNRALPSMGPIRIKEYL